MTVLFYSGPDGLVAGLNVVGGAGVYIRSEQRQFPWSSDWLRSDDADGSWVGFD